MNKWYSILFYIVFRGQTLEQIEKFDDPRSSDEEDEEGKKFGGLDGKRKSLS